MIDIRLCALALSASLAAVSVTVPASAATFNGNWNMTAVTTRGHCGIIPIGMGIRGSRVQSTSGSFAFYPIKLGGRVSRSGHIRPTAIAGPRIAHGTGRLMGFEGKGTWQGRGPSGLCSGVWKAVRG